MSRRTGWAFALGVCVLAAAPRAAAVDAGERGYPLVRAVVPTAADADVQNFDVAADPRGLVYAANLGGVLVHDGAWWRTLPVGDAASAFSIAVDAAGRVAVGGIGEIGYLETAAPEGPQAGGPRYVSLVDRLPEELRDFNQVLRVVAARRGFVFATTGWLLWWDGADVLRALGTYSGDRPFTIPFAVGEETYVWSRDGGLERLAFDAGAPALAPYPGGDLFRGRRVDLVLPADGGALLVSVRGEGLFLLAAGAAAPFAREAGRWAADHRVLAGVRLADGRWALGSVVGGLLLVAPDGGVVQLIVGRVGLPDDLVYAMAVDRDGGLWLALNTDLARIDVASPLSLVDRRAGLAGSVYHAARHRGAMWAATAAGLFVLATGEAAGAGGGEAVDGGVDDAARPPVRVRPVAGLPPGVWHLLSAGDDLLVGTAGGVYRLAAVGGPPQPVSGLPDLTAYVLVASPSDPRRVWAGFDDGLHLLVREAGGWRGVDHRVLPSPVRAVVEKDGVVWCATELDGIFAFAVPAAGGPLSPPVHQLASDGEVALHLVGGRILATVDGRVRALDETRAELVAEPALDRLGRHDFLYALAEDAEGNLWLNTRPPSVALAAADGDGWSPPRPLVEVTARAVESFVVEPDGVVWLASDDGLYRWVGSPRSSGGPLPAPRVARVTSGGGETLYLAGVAEAAFAAPPSLDLPPDVRRLRIAFAPLTFRLGLAYETRLDPIDDEWSTAGREPFAELTRLPPGGYTFRVRTVGPDMMPGPVTAWSFDVRAPWYHSPWALTLWLLAAFALVRAYAGLRHRALRQRAEELERRVDEQTVELRATVDELRSTQSELETANRQLEELSLQDDLTGVANRRRLQLALDAEWNRARRRGRPVAFILLDLDHFKSLNDSRGHREGDKALQQVAAYLDAAVQRPGDLLVRYGGEEFAVLLPDTDLPGALAVAERLRRGLEALALPHEGTPAGCITASFGVAVMVPAKDQPPGSLIEAADHALYRAKTEGRNLVRAEGIEGEGVSPSAN